MIPAFLINLALGAGIPQKYAKLVVVAVLVVLLVAGLGIGKCAYDRSVIEDHETKRELKVTKRLNKANNQAADERVGETIALERRQREVQDAINSVPDSAPSAAAVRHNCERLRRAGRDVSRIPACGGRAGGD